VWSARLTHNYLRREGWEFGKREDWRFNEMRGQYGKTWWWMSFFAVYLSQQVVVPFHTIAQCRNDNLVMNIQGGLYVSYSEFTRLFAGRCS
jgi:steroid 5-alpha reductase family enzyme